MLKQKHKAIAPVFVKFTEHVNMYFLTTLCKCSSPICARYKNESLPLDLLLVQTQPQLERWVICLDLCFTYTFGLVLSIPV